ncbi:MAG: AAA family ATPase [Nanoarchaeota archaeon]
MIDDQALAKRSQSDLLSQLVSAGDRQASVLLLGQRKSGKTTLLRIVSDELEAKGSFCRTLDLGRVHTPPELFSLQVAGLAACWSLSLTSRVLDAAFLKQHKDKLSPKQQANIDVILTELQKIKPDQRRCIQAAFAMLEELGKEKRLVLFLDNVERLLELDNFSAVGDVFALLPRNITIIASSAVPILKDRLHGFTAFTITPLTKEHASSLVVELAGKQPQQVLDEIHALCKGDAYATSVVSKRLATTKSVRAAFLTELVWTEGLLYRRCADLYNAAMSRARGQALLDSAMVLLGQKDMKLSELARQLYRSAPVTKSVLERLMQVSLVVKDEKSFSVADPLLKEWLRTRPFWTDDEPGEAQLKEVRP